MLRTKSPQASFYGSYLYDRVNDSNLAAREDEAASETERFSYDNLDRLTGVSGPYGESYAYDTIGNMTSKNSVAYTYGARPHAVLFVGNYALAYDANGNMTERNNATGSQVLSWNMSNQLARVEGIGRSYTDTTTFVYDGDGRRIAKTAGTTTTVYPNRYYEKTGSEGTSNYYLGDRLVAVKKGSVLEYIHQDHLGSSSVSSNSASGAETTSNKYYPFGTSRSSSDTLGNLVQITDAKGNTTTNAYGWLSRKTSVADPDMEHWSYAYDNNGNLVSQTDARNTVLTFTYDALGRMTAKKNGANTLASYSHDSTAGGNRGKGRRTGRRMPPQPLSPFPRVHCC